MMTVRAVLTAFSFVGIALNGALAQNSGVGLAEPPVVPRANPAVAAPNPYAMTPYAGNAPLAANPAGLPGVAPAVVPGSPVTTMPASGADRSKPLGIGDQINFQIMEDKDEPVSKRVLDTGELEVPYIGRVNATGRTCDQVSAEVKKRLEAEFYYKATVRLDLEQVSMGGRPVGRIYLSGLIRMPGPQDLLPGEKTTVSAAILKAGGAAQFGDQGKVKVTRKGAGGSPETFTVDVKAILTRGKMELDREVKDGDYIFVPQKVWNIGM